jgi:hypothetical protein
MRSGLNIFLLIGAIVTNIVVSQPDDFDRIIGLRDRMVQVIDECLDKRSRVDTTATEPFGINSNSPDVLNSQVDNTAQEGSNSAAEITTTDESNNLSKL